MKLLRRFVLALIGLLVVTGLLLAWLLATESGAKFIVGQVKSRLPAAVAVGDVTGRFSDELRLSSIEWQSATTQVAAKHIAVRLDLMALFVPKIRLESLQFGALDILQKSAELPDTSSASTGFSLDFRSPVFVVIDSAQLRNVRWRSESQVRSLDIVSFSGRLQDADLQLEKIQVQSDWLRLRADANLQLQAPYNLSLSGNWTLAAYEKKFAGLLSIEGDAAEYSVDHRLQLPVAVSTTGELMLKPVPQINLLNQWTDLEARIGSVAIGSDAGRLVLNANAAGFDINLHTSGRVNSRAIESVDVDLRGSGENIELETLRVALEGLQLAANGKVILSQNKQNLAQLNVRMDVDPATVLHPELTGAIGLDSQLHAHFDGSEFTGLSATVDSISGRLQGQDLNGHATVDYANKVWTVRDLKLTSGVNEVDADASLGSQTMQAQIDIAAQDMRQLWPDLAGRLKGKMTVKGSRKKPVVQASLMLRDFEAFESSLERLDIDASLSQEQHVDLQLSATAAKVGQHVADTMQLSLTGSQQAHEWQARIDHEAVSVDLKAAGRYEESVYELLVQALDAVAQNQPAWTLSSPGKIRWDSTGSIAKDLCLQGGDSEQVCIETARWSAIGWELKANANQLPIRPLLAFLPLELDGSGTTSATVSLRSSGTGPAGQFDLGLNDTAVWVPATEVDESDKLTIGLNVSGEIVADELISTLQLRTGNLGIADADIRLGSISQGDGPIAIGLQLDFPQLNFLDTLFPHIDIHSGKILGKANLSGLRSAPTGSGSFQLEEGAVSLLALGTNWKDVSLTLSPASPMIWNLDGGFSSGDGRLSLDGVLNLDRHSDPWLKLDVNGEQAQLVQLPDMALSASPKLSLSMGRSEASLTGTLQIPNGRIAIEELPEGAVESSADVVVHQQDSDRVADTYPLRLALDLVVGPALQIDAFGLNSRLRGDLELKSDTTSQLQAFGNLELRDGRFEAYGQELDISRGRMSFRGPLDNPQLDFRARREVSVGEVGIEMGGTVNAPESSLYSSPAMPESEILSWLLTGRGLNESSPENGERLSNAALALGLSRAGAIVAELGGQLGLDRFEIADEDGGERLLAGKWVSEALYLQYAYGIFDKLGSVLLRYRLSRRFTLESRSGAEQSLDLIYEVGRSN